MGLKKELDVIKYKKAIDFSYNFYQSKYRKGVKIPYFTYLTSVSSLIIENNGNTDEAIAGLFHDLLEFDTNKKTTNIIKNRFGIKVLNIVKQCSNVVNSKKENFKFCYKIGLQFFFTKKGRHFISKLKDEEIFLDIK